MPDEPRDPGAPEPEATEPEATEPDPLSERHRQALQQFVLLWGEMATYWGINRTMAQIHALLYAVERPLDTDEIMERLQISRGNANMNLRSLVDWDLVRKTHQLGSRKDFYVAEKDIWKISTTIIQERQRREIAPVGEALTSCIAEMKAGGELSEREAVFLDRMESMQEFMQVFDEFTEALLPFLHERNARKVQKLTGFAARLGRKGTEPQAEAPQAEENGHG
jgi:DNA-binding transcriptional regulator GbsR (MarR family)